MKGILRRMFNSGDWVVLVHGRPLRSKSGWRASGIGGKEIWPIEINGIACGLLCRSVVFAQLGREHPHVLLLGEPTSHGFQRYPCLAIKEVEGGAVIVSHNFRNCELREEKDKTIKDFIRWGSLGKSMHHRLQEESYHDGSCYPRESKFYQQECSGGTSLNGDLRCFSAVGTYQCTYHQFRRPEYLVRHAHALRSPTYSRNCICILS